MESEYNFDEKFKRCDPLNNIQFKTGKIKEVKENDVFFKTMNKLEKLNKIILYLKNKRTAIENEFPIAVRSEEYFEIDRLVFYYRKRIIRAVELYYELFSSLKNNFSPHCLVILEHFFH